MRIGKMFKRLPETIKIIAGVGAGYGVVLLTFGAFMALVTSGKFVTPEEYLYYSKIILLVPAIKGAIIGICGMAEVKTIGKGILTFFSCIVIGPACMALFIWPSVELVKLISSMPVELTRITDMVILYSTVLGIVVLLGYYFQDRLTMPCTKRW